MIEFCAQCTPQVRLVEGECPKCAWKPPKRGRRDRTDADKPHDGCCDYQHNGTRCQMPGTFSPNIRKGGPWYCREHSDETRRRDMARQDEFFAYIADPENRKRLWRKWYPSTAQRAEFERELVSRAPERRPGESASEYVARLREVARSITRRRISQSDQLRETESDPA